jgi:uncharacterized membrane protein YhaH (DUF805 family)
MTFIDAVKICFQKYVTFSGRARRAEYWWWSLFIIIGNLVFGGVDTVFFGVPEITGPTAGLFSLATFLPACRSGFVDFTMSIVPAGGRC